jgi:hypothetical protein
MSRDNRGGVTPIKPGSSTTQILGAIIRRHGGKVRTADSSYRLPDPPRPRSAGLEGEPELFDDGTS